MDANNDLYKPLYVMDSGAEKSIPDDVNFVKVIKGFLKLIEQNKETVKCKMGRIILVFYLLCYLDNNNKFMISNATFRTTVINKIISFQTIERITENEKTDCLSDEIYIAKTNKIMDHLLRKLRLMDDNQPLKN